MKAGENSWRSQFGSWKGLVVTAKRSFSAVLSVHSFESRASSP
jgi:hypothetical protein